MSLFKHALTALFLQCLIDFVSSINPPGGSGWSVSSRVGFLISLPLEIHGFSRHTNFCGLVPLTVVDANVGLTAIR